MSTVDAAALIATRVVAAVAAAFDVEITPEQAIVRVAKPGQGWDYQANVAMGLAKRLGKPSPEVGAAIVAHLDLDPIADPPEVAGPGFINIRVRSEWLGSAAAAQLADERLGVPVATRPRKVIVDYSAPNVAKEMHVGHLRSSIIGDALVRMLRHAGHEAIPQNHLGDWGTPFGMLIEHMLDEGASGSAGLSIGDLNAFYQSAREKFDADTAFQERARLRVVSLQGGDEDTLALWRELVRESQGHFEQVYDLLGVGLTEADLAPESLYNSRLAPTIEELKEKGLIVESDGALCVFPPGFKTRDGDPLPLIAQKSDGGYTYDTTDLAAIRYRMTELQVDASLYVVGSPQRIHFEMIFAAARMAGWLTDDREAYHVQFGSVLGEDGKILRTRSGAPIRLIALLEEAVERAGDVIASRGAERDPALAKAVGVGAVKYADLSSDRERDYVFSFDRMLSLEGNTSVYLQYANARCLSVLRKAGTVPDAPSSLVLTEPAERDLALRLLRLSTTLDEVLSDYRPHRLCTYLYETAAAYSVFYEQCPILTAESDDVRASRLALCALTSKVLAQGLDLLGIEAPESL